MSDKTKKMLQAVLFGIQDNNQKRRMHPLTRKMYVRCLYRIVCSEEDRIIYNKFLENNDKLKAD